MSLQSTSRKALALILTPLALIMGPAMTPQPAMAENSIASEENDSVIKLRQFLSQRHDGTISFDRNAAEQAGNDPQAISIVDSQITLINSMINSGQTVYISDDFDATVWLQGSRARGVNKTVIHWYGLTEWYMDSDKASELVNALDKAGDVATFAFLAGKYSWIPSVFVAGAYVYKAAVVNAAAPGRGIIMKQQVIFGSTEPPMLWYESQ